MDSTKDPSTNNYEVIEPQRRLEGSKAEMERSKREAETRTPSLKVTRVGAYSVAPEDHSSLMNALAASDWHFYEGIIKQAVQAGWSPWGYNEVLANFVLSVAKGIEPRDQVETMIGVQMGAVHAAIMILAPQLVEAPTPQAMESYQRAVTKLMRAFVGLVEALNRHRSKGEQKVTVQHVSVQDGGQAIVSQNVSRARGGRRRKKATAAGRALSDSKIAPMEILDDDREKDGAEAPAAADAKK